MLTILKCLLRQLPNLPVKPVEACVGKLLLAIIGRQLWKKFPDLTFTLLHALCGANSVALIYDGVLGLSNEVFHFGADGKVIRAYAHYDH